MIPLPVCTDTSANDAIFIRLAVTEILSYIIQQYHNDSSDTSLRAQTHYLSRTVASLLFPLQQKPLARLSIAFA